MTISLVGTTPEILLHADEATLTFHTRPIESICLQTPTHTKNVLKTQSTSDRVHELFHQRLSESACILELKQLGEENLLPKPMLLEVHGIEIVTSSSMTLTLAPSHSLCPAGLLLCPLLLLTPGQPCSHFLYTLESCLCPLPTLLHTCSFFSAHPPFESCNSLATDSCK